MKTIYKTREWKGSGKHDYYHNEYRVEGDEVTEYKCHRSKFFDGNENNWSTEEKIVDSWNVDDSNIPDWLKKYL